MDEYEHQWQATVDSLTAERDALKADIDHLIAQGHVREKAYAMLQAENARLRSDLSRLQDVAQYANAIGQIDAVLGIAGNAPVSETVAGVEALRAERANWEKIANRCADADGEARRQLTELREAGLKFLVTPYSADSQREFRAVLAKLTSGT